MQDELISREAAVEAIDKWYEKNRGEAFFDDYIEDLIIAVTYLPSVQPRREGHWRDYSEDGYVECPFCEHATNCEDDIDELHYCFYCGAELSADMRGDTDAVN